MPTSTSAHGTNEVHTESLVDVAWIADHLDDPGIRLVERDVSRAAYDQGHIPGAVLWNAYADLRRPDYSPLSATELEALLAASGVTVGAQQPEPEVRAVPIDDDGRFRGYARGREDRLELGRV